MPRRLFLSIPGIAAGLLAAGLAASQQASAAGITISLTGPTDNAGIYTYDYLVTDPLTNATDSINEIEIPELNAGDLVLTQEPTGWTETENTTSLDPNLSLGGPHIGANIVLETTISGDEIPANGGTGEFIFTSDYGSTLASDWQALDHAGGPHIDGVPVPDSSQPNPPIPEPASLAVFAMGLLGLGRAIRRRQPRKNADQR